MSISLLASTYILLLTTSPGCTSQHSSLPNVAWEDRIEVAEGAGYQGPWRMNASVFKYVDDPTAALMDNGEIGVGWVEQSRKNIFFQRIRSNGRRLFVEPVNVSKSPGIFSWLPDIVMTDGNPPHVYMLWQEIVFSGGTHGGEIYFSRSTNGGRSFEEPLNLSNSIAGDGKGRLTKKFWHNGSLDLERGPSGMLYAAWTEYEGRLWVSRSVDSGQSFAQPIHISGSNEKPARGPSLATDTAGKVYLAWTVGQRPNANIHISRSSNYGRSFSTPKVVASSAGHADGPGLIADSKGRLHLVYGLSPTGPFDRYEIRYTRSSGNELNFASPQTLPTPQSLKYEMSHFPSIARSDNQQILVTWNLYRHPAGRPEAMAFTYSDNGGDSFAPPVVVPGTHDPQYGMNGSQQGYLLDKIAVNGKGDFAILNSTFQRGRESHVWLYPGRLK